MSRAASFTLALTLTACSFAVAGCSDARCDPMPVGDAWKPYESLLPDNAVVCGPNRSSEKKPAKVVDDYPPTHVFVFYEEKDTGKAYDATISKFEAAGWTAAPAKIYGEGDKKYTGKVSKDDVSISITVNRNDWGTQGSFDLELPAAP